MHSFPAFPAADWNMDRFSERLRQLRSERNITQTRLAELLDVDQRVYSRWERGVVTPHFDTIVKIADILNVSIDELAARNDSKDSNVDMKIRNPELHKLCQKVNLLSDEDQKALAIVLNSFVKLSSMRRTLAET